MFSTITSNTMSSSPTIHHGLDVQGSKSHEKAGTEEDAKTDQDIEIRRVGRLVQCVTNPLELNNILDTTFDYLRHKDLLVCREVCKRWDVVTRSLTRSKISLRMPRNRTINSNVQIPGLEGFVKRFKSNTLGIPFGAFKLESFCMTEGVGQEFLQLCGHTTWALDLWRSTSNQDKFCIEDLSAILQSMPKLEYLMMPNRLGSRAGNIVKLFPDSKPNLSSLKRIVIPNELHPDVSKFCPTSFEELLTAAQNISEFYLLSGLSWKHSSIDKSNLNILKTIEQVGRVSAIQIMYLDYGRSEHIECLHRMAEKPNGLKLKTLTFIPHYQEPENIDTFKLAPLFKNSLEHLSLDQSSAFTSFNEFPRMPLLKSLTFKIWTEFNSRFINLNQKFPVLEKLVVRRWGSRSREYKQCDEFLPNSEPCPKVKSLHFGNVMKIKVFHQILTVFPSLTKLELRNVNEEGGEIIRTIWTEMTQLVRLSLQGTLPSTENLDSLFTGIPINIIYGMGNFAENLHKMTPELRREVILKFRNRHSQYFSIVNLTNLKYLHLRLDAESKVVRNRLNYLTDLSGYFGFYSMKGLCHLFIDKSKIENSCLEILMAETEILDVKFDTNIYDASQKPI